MAQGKKLRGGKTVKFKFRVGECELEKFVALSKSKHLDVSEYIRRLMRREVLEEARKPAPVDKLAEFNKRLLPHERSHVGGPGVLRMRRAGLPEGEIKRRVTDWLLKPVPRDNRLNGYTRSLRLSPKDRLINHLTPEQREKAESIFRHMCEKHKYALARHPLRYGVYWACAVSRVRATGTYDQQRHLRNRLKAPLNRIVLADADKNVPR